MQKIAYAAGPGDVAGTYRRWAQGEADPNEVSETYSGQFFEQVRAFEFSAFVIASHPRRDLIEDGRFTIEHLPQKRLGKKGLSFHIADIGYWLRVMWRIKRARCSVAVISDMEHWWLLTFLRLAGVKVVPTLHCTFWPKGFRPTSKKNRVVYSLNGWFWRHVPSATIVVSPECKRQVELVAGNRFSGLMLQGLAKYRAEYFAAMQPPVWSARPFRLMFAGRIEENKGVFDLVTLMQRLIFDVKIEVFLEVCGDGSAFQNLKQKVMDARLGSSIMLHGKLAQAEMFDVFQRCHVVIVPTTGAFAEGFNQVVAEGVLSGRPVVATSVCPANELFPNSVIEIGPGDVGKMVEAVTRLATDQNWYSAVRSYGAKEGNSLYDEAHSWGAAVGRALEHAQKLR